MNPVDSHVTAEEFRALFASVSTWQPDDVPRRAQRPGALGHLTATQVRAAARLVDSGATVSLGRTLDTHRSADNTAPAVHVMTATPLEWEAPSKSAAAESGSAAKGTNGGGLQFAKDYIGIDYHNDTHSHLDALCHVDFDGLLYGGWSADTITSYGAEVGTVGLLEAGLVGRGVLLDIPRLRDVSWLEPGEHIYAADLEAAERAQNVQVGTGDILLVRTGHALRLAELGPWDTAHAKAGLHPTTASYLARRRIAALGSDGNSDTAPSTTEGVGFPMHVLALNAIGIHLLDYLQFEDLVRACEARGRWEFMFVAAPLRIHGGTGSPVNPIAIF